MNRGLSHDLVDKFQTPAKENLKQKQKKRKRKNGKKEAKPEAAVFKKSVNLRGAQPAS
jgi:hypothetical protein